MPTDGYDEKELLAKLRLGISDISSSLDQNGDASQTLEDKDQETPSHKDGKSAEKNLSSSGNIKDRELYNFYQVRQSSKDFFFFFLLVSGI